MNTKRHSYGVLPIWKGESEHTFFLVNQAEREDGTRVDAGHWTFAKGTPEGGETPLETATRETREETGMRITNILKDNPFTISYSFHEDGVDIQKQVTYFLGFPETLDFQIDDHEIIDAGWFTLDEAKEKLIYKASEELLDKVVAFLNTLDN